MMDSRTGDTSGNDGESSQADVQNEDLSTNDPKAAAVRPKECGNKGL